MDVIIRVARIAVVLILVVVAVTLVIGMSRPETGAVEKVVLTALVAGCIAGGAGVTRVANRLRARASLIRSTDVPTIAPLTFCDVATSPGEQLHSPRI